METDIKPTLKKLQQICSRQEKCKADIMDYLIRHDIPQQWHEPVIQSLTADKFIDEERYARAAVQDKFRLNRWGRIKIRYFLRSKRLTEEVIQKAIQGIDEEEYRRVLDQGLKKKAQTLKKEDPGTRKMKLLQFAASKGFEEDLVWKIMKDE